MKRNKLTLEECLQVAYNDIKDRKGRMVDGILVKEGDNLMTYEFTSESVSKGHPDKVAEELIQYVKIYIINNNINPERL